MLAVPLCAFLLDDMASKAVRAIEAASREREAAEFIHHRSLSAGAAHQRPNTTFGFYLPVFNEVSGVVAVLNSVRKFYPDSPVHLLQDGGTIDFSGICNLSDYNCTFEIAQPYNSPWNPHPFLINFWRAAKVLNTTFIIYLEPDVLVTRRHRLEPQHDAGGIYDNFNFGIPTRITAYVEKLGRERDPCFKVRWAPHWGLAGGSYFRTVAVLDAFSPRHLHRLDIAGMYKFHGGQICNSDVIMILALSARAWTVYPWAEAGQRFPDTEAMHPDRQREYAARYPAYHPDAAFQHNRKESYNKMIPGRERSVLRTLETPKWTVRGVCIVWFLGVDMEHAVFGDPPPLGNGSSNFLPQSRGFLIHIRQLLWDPLWPRAPLPARCTVSGDAGLSWISILRNFRW